MQNIAQRILLRLGWLLVSFEPVARALASNMLRTHDVDYLDPTGTQRELERQYMIVAVECGLPGRAAREVAQKAWGYMVANRRLPKPNRKEFSFYG